jgi:apolipoprotein N-acyltransferase
MVRTLVGPRATFDDGARARRRKPPLDAARHEHGFTAAIDPYGRTVASLPTDVRAELDAPYAFRSDVTPYARFGDWFSWLCVIASIALIAFAFAPKTTRGE